MRDRIKFFKLNCGDEFVAEVIPNEDVAGVVNVKNPVMFAPSPQGTMMMPAFFGADETCVSLPEEAIMFITNPHVTAINAYDKQYGTGLVLPDEKVSVPFPGQ